MGWRLAPKRCQPCGEKRRGEERDYCTRTGHCGACGQPGNFCLCGTPCGCQELHEVGSGRTADAAEVFSDVPVIDGQGEMFA
jgi:hypothetical protein